MATIELIDINPQVGEAAGKVWHALSEQGPLTLTELKKKLNGSSELVGLAIGWLAREDKVAILPEKKTLRVQLR
ncbi:MAG TPA: winged helix-turn-helix domain-containing protein [Terriglobia bacterium]|nr:winged helix-turn-helix domain-containing protein [Terriglobia bacterium]